MFSSNLGLLLGIAGTAMRISNEEAAYLMEDIALWSRSTILNMRPEKLLSKIFASFAYGDMLTASTTTGSTSIT